VAVIITTYSIDDRHYCVIADIVQVAPFARAGARHRGMPIGARAKYGGISS
jgi:hypothetical protein